MNRKTKNASLLETIKRQEQLVRSLQAKIGALEERERQRDEVWQRHNDVRIKEINEAIRTAKTPQDYMQKIDKVFGGRS